MSSLLIESRQRVLCFLLFIIYVKAVYNYYYFIIYEAININIIERMWKEVIVAYFEALPRHLSVELKMVTKTLTTIAVL
jgi:hypothetical protein